MNVLIKAAKILDASSPHHNTIQDIYIADGVIQKMVGELKFQNIIFRTHNNKNEYKR